MMKKSTQKRQPRKGRRPGNTSTREEILAAAKRLFAEKGFHGTTLRSIATCANVDVALVSHFFGSKDDLFLESIRVPTNVFQPLLDAFDGPAHELGERFVHAYLKIWETPSAGGRLLSTIRSAFPHEQTSAFINENSQSRLINDFSAQIEGAGVEDARARAEMVFAILFGIVLGRYVIRSRELAEFDAATIADMLAPTVQQMLAPDAAISSLRLNHSARSETIAPNLDSGERRSARFAQPQNRSRRHREIDEA